MSSAHCFSSGFQYRIDHLVLERALALEVFDFLYVVTYPSRYKTEGKRKKRTILKLKGRMYR